MANHNFEELDPDAIERVAGGVGAAPSRGNDLFGKKARLQE